MKINVYFLSFLTHFFLEGEMFQSCRENQNTFYVPQLFSKVVPFMRKWENVEKYCRLGHATAENMALAHCMLDMQQLTIWRVRIACRICNSWQYGACALHAGYATTDIWRVRIACRICNSWQYGACALHAGYATADNMARAHCMLDMPQLTIWRVRIACRICNSWQYGACALHAGYVGLQIHAQVVFYLLFFQCDNRRAVVLSFTFITCLVLHLWSMRPVYTWSDRTICIIPDQTNVVLL